MKRKRFSEEQIIGITQVLNEARDHAQGKGTGAIVHQIETPTVDVAAIRAKTGLLQGAFARSIGVAKGTLLNWEHGRRRLTGPAQVLLAMNAKKSPLVNSCADIFSSDAQCANRG